MAEFVKLKTELVNGRYRNIYTKKNGKRQYVKYDGNYVLLSVFNQNSQKPSKKSCVMRSTPQPVFHGGKVYTSDDDLHYEIENGIKYVVDKDTREYLLDPFYENKNKNRSRMM